MTEQLLSALPLVADFPTPPSENTSSPTSASLTILDVGHGNCAILKDSRGVIVIDAGAGNTLLEYLHESGTERIDTVILSHADHDHINGLTALCSAGRFQIRQVLLNSDSTKRSASFDNLAYELSLRHDRGELRFCPAIVPDFHGTYNVGEVVVEILAPSGYLAVRGPGSTDRSRRLLTSNSTSAVVRLVHPGFGPVLFTGDLDWSGLDELLSRLQAERMRARLLVFPHHGGRPGEVGLMRQFVRRLVGVVNPEIVVFSIGRGRYGAPHPDIIEEVRRQLPSAWIACTQLSKNCTDDVPSASPGHLSSTIAAGRLRRSCCVGTMVIQLQPVPQIQPLRAQHLQFVQQAAPAALCLRSIVAQGSLI